MLQIGIDARPLNRDHLRGMGKYIADLICAADRMGQFRWHGFADRPDLAVHRPGVASLEIELFETRGYRFRLWEQWGLPRRARRAKVDILHCPATTLPVWQPVPTVVTLHDTIPWQGESNGDPRWYTHRLLPRAYHKCAAVITDSESSRRDIISLWPDLEPKVHVIPLGAAQQYFECEPAPLSNPLLAAGVREPYLLYLGGEIPRKRLPWALRVFEALAEPNLQIVLCGVEQHSAAHVLEQIAPELRERVVIPPFIPESEMPRLYQNAIAILYPTLYEGFGLPAVEAEAVGTPVLFSHVASLVELEGPGAHVLPKDDLNAWHQTCRRLVEERRNNAQPNEAARQWARRFSWDESARKHLEVYELAIRQRKSS